MIFLPCKKKKIFWTVVSIVFFFSIFALVVHAGNIDATWHTARFLQDGSEIEFGLAAGNVTVTDTAMTGYTWAENAGWITFVATTAAQSVVNDGSGNLSGYAWGEGTGWINFNPTNGGVSIDSSGYFHGYAWSQKKGWIVFNCDTDSTCGTFDHKVKTSWTAPSATCSDGIQNGNETGIDTGGSCGGGGGGGGGGGTDVCPNIPGAQATIPPGYIFENGICVPEFSPQDYCPNISGIQSSIPSGMTIDIQTGYCVVLPPPPPPPPVDVCPNIDDVQTSVPPGYTKIDGNCVPYVPDDDYCPNIEGIQTAVPDGMTVDTQTGECVDLPNPPPPPPEDVCSNIDGIQVTVPQGLVKVLGNCFAFSGITQIIDTTKDVFNRIPYNPTLLRSSQILSVIGLVFSSFVIPWRSLLNSVFIFFAFRKKERPWGTVYDSITKEPLDPAYVTLHITPDGGEKASAITDLDGRYGFLTQRGKYFMRARKTNYTFPSVKLQGKNHDEVYSDLYFGEEFEIAKDDDVITKNIPLDPTTFDWNEFAKRDKKLLRYYSKWDKFLGRAAEFLFIFGIFTSIYNIMVEPNILNNVILGLYGLLLIIRLGGFKPRSHGTVVDRATGIPLSFAVVRVMSANFPVEIAHAVADVYGKYYCLVPDGTYKIAIDRKDFGENYTRVYSSDVINVRRGIIRTHFRV